MLQRSSQVGEFYRMMPPPVWNADKLLPGQYLVRHLSLEPAHRTRHRLSAVAMMASSPSLDAACVARFHKRIAPIAANRKRASDWYYANKERARKAQAEYYAQNKAAILLQQKTYYERNRAWILMREKLHNKANRAHITAQKKYRRHTDEVYNLMCSQRSRLKRYLRATKTIKAAAAFTLIGCTAAELRDHLKRQLPDDRVLREMEVDHIFPLARYKPDEQHKFMHWSNVQPLTRAENRLKWYGLPTKAMAAKVERWAWPDGVTEDNLPESLQRDTSRA